MNKKFISYSLNIVLVLLSIALLKLSLTITAVAFSDLENSKGKDGTLLLGILSSKIFTDGELYLKVPNYSVYPLFILILLNLWQMIRRLRR